jgi:hypothetical protein
MSKVVALSKELDNISLKFSGQPAKASSEEIPPATVPLNWRVNHMIFPNWEATSNITKNQKVAYEVLSEELPAIINDLKRIQDVDLKAIEKELNSIDAPWTPGRLPEMN